MLPEFNVDGNLPAGVHKAEWPEFREKFSYNRCRKKLVRGMLAALKGLKKAGCSTVFIDGSYVTNTRKPNDYDGCRVTTGMDAGLSDPTFKDFRFGRIAQKVKFAGEFFHVTDTSRSGQTMLDFFRRTETAIQRES